MSTFFARMLLGNYWVTPSDLTPNEVLTSMGVFRGREHLQAQWVNMDLCQQYHGPKRQIGPGKGFKIQGVPTLLKLQLIWVGCGVSLSFGSISDVL